MVERRNVVSQKVKILFWGAGLFSWPRKESNPDYQRAAAGWTDGRVFKAHNQCGLDGVGGVTLVSSASVLGIGSRFCTLRREQWEGSRAGLEVVGRMRGMQMEEGGRGGVAI